MWNIAVLAVLTSVIGMALIPNERGLSRVDDFNQRAQATEMAVYREAVIRFLDANPAATLPVSVATLRANKLIPDWSSLKSDGAALKWTHKMDAERILYVYPKVMPDKNLIPELLDISHRSALIAVYRASGSALYFPTSATPYPVTVAGIPDGTPVWIAKIK